MQLYFLFALASAGNLCVENVCKNCYQRIRIDKMGKKGKLGRLCGKLLDKPRCCHYFFLSTGMIRPVKTCDVEMKDINVTSISLDQSYSSAMLISIIEGGEIIPKELTADPCQLRTNSNTDLAVSIIIVALGTALVVIGIVIYNKKTQKPSSSPTETGIASRETKDARDGALIVNTINVGTQIPLLASETHYTNYSQ